MFATEFSTPLNKIMLATESPQTNVSYFALTVMFA